jgi:Tol biopolymer transport system component
LNHPGIVTIHDIGESGGEFYIVMELVDGTSLRQLLRRGRPRLRKALHLASQLADALAKAHDIGIVHCDLKPENIMLSGEGHIKIVDFGLAKLADAGPGDARVSNGTSTNRSTERLLIGTVGYMSPEQAIGENADFRSDQFAFGAILYELTTGARAFQRQTSVETLSMIINGEPERPLAVNPALPLPVVWTIERCLSKDPADRYASTRDLARDLQTLRDHAVDLDMVEGAGLIGRTRRSRLLALGAAAGAVALGAAAAGMYFTLGPGRPPVAEMPALPTFQQLTFRRGFIQNARFAPGGQGIIYAAGWDGAPVRLFETGPLGPESRPIGPSHAGLASISSGGEVAVIQGCRLDWANCIGTLATMPLGVDAPREVLEAVVSADWAPDGRALAAIHVADGEYRLQFPIGKQLYATAGRLGWLAFSPRGDRIAFVEYPLLDNEAGSVKVVDLEGRATTISSEWKTIRGLVWSPAGDELWVSATDRGRRCSLYGLSLTGERRLLFHAPADVVLLDRAPDGRALIASNVPRTHMIWSNADAQRELSWLDWSTVADLSADGKTVLFYEWGEGVGATPVVYLRKVDGSDAVELGPGKALALSPDGRWALALLEGASPHLVLLPAGAGESRQLPAAGLTDFYWARWFPDGRRLLIVGAGADAIPGSYIQDTVSGKLEPIAEKGMLASLVSPDGLKLLIADPLGPYQLWPLDGGQPTTMETLKSEDRPFQWSADGRFLYLRGPEETSIRIYRYNLATGRRELWQELAPRDPTAVIGVATGRGELAMTPDGKGYVFTYWTAMRSLFLGDTLPK